MSKLDKIVIAAPCSISWESMRGNDRVRHCQGCSRSVYNLSDMSKDEAGKFLAENGVSQCLRFYRRTDGTIMTDNCPVGLRELRKKCRLMLKIASGFISSIFVFAPVAKAQECANRDNNADPHSVAIEVYKKTGQVRFDLLKKWEAQKPQKKENNESVTAGVPILTDYRGEPAFMGKVAAARPVRPVKAVMMPAEDCSKDDLLPSSIEVEHNYANDERPSYADHRALSLYLQGLANEKDGNFFLAQTCYRNALSASKKPVNSDPQFQLKIERAIRSLNERLDIKENLSR